MIADGQAGILKQSSHPMSLAFLYLFRSAAIAVYVLCGLCQLPYLDSELKLTAVTDNYVLSVCTGERELKGAHVRSSSWLCCSLWTFGTHG